MPQTPSEIIGEMLTEFNQKFQSPKTLWAQDEKGKWYSKKDVEAFLKSSLLHLAESVPIKVCNCPDSHYCDPCEYPPQDEIKSWIREVKETVNKN